MSGRIWLMMGGSMARLWWLINNRLMALQNWAELLRTEPLTREEWAFACTHCAKAIKLREREITSEVEFINHVRNEMHFYNWQNDPARYDCC